MRDTARLQVLALAILGAVAWVSVGSGQLDHALARLLPPATHEAPAVNPILDPRVPVLGDESLTPEPKSLDRLRPATRPAGADIWIVATPPDAFVG